jgi:hypothetical protein
MRAEVVEYDIELSLIKRPYVFEELKQFTPSLSSLDVSIHFIGTEIQESNKMSDTKISVISCRYEIWFDNPILSRLRSDFERTKFVKA